jgi:cobalamin biosynthesis protein CbiG
MNAPAIVVLTPRGATLGQRIVTALGQGEVIAAEAAVREKLTQAFQAGRPLVCVMALGIAVRVLGPLAKDKETDPPVVVVDEAGHFAVSVLGGHAGGGNDLARKVAEVIGATPVITTASDALGLPALDLVGREWGWKIDHREDLPKVMAALVRGELLGLYQEAGRDPFGPWADRLQRLTAWPPSERWPGLLAVSDRRLSEADSPYVIYRPPSLVLGVGCKRDVPCQEIEDLFQEVCQVRGFSPLSLGLVATIVLKADEPGLCQFAAQHGVPLQSFSLDEIAEQVNIPTPSAKVKEKIGVSGVAEPSAMLGAKTQQLLVTKYTGKRTTMALARREDV